MELKRNMKIPSTEAVVELMKEQTKVLPPCIDLYRLQTYITDARIRMSCILDKIQDELIAIGNTLDVSELGVTKAINVIINSIGCVDYLAKTDKNAPSYNEESLKALLQLPMIGEHERVIIKKLIVFRKYSTRYTSLMSLRRKPIDKPKDFKLYRSIVTKTGSPVISCEGLTYSSQYTGRITATNPALGNIDRECKDMYAVPKGYELFSVDLGQTDPRHLFYGLYKDPLLAHCINMYNDAYFGALHYCLYVPSTYFNYIDTLKISTETSEELITSLMTTDDFSAIKPREITDEMKSNRSRLKKELNGINYGKSSPEVLENTKLFLAMQDRLQNHPIRRKLMEDIYADLRKGKVLFKTILGVEFDISKSAKYSKYIGNLESLSRLVIAGIGQGTTANCNSILLFEVRKTLDRYCPSAVIMLNVHDSIMVAIPDSFKLKKELCTFIEKGVMHITWPELWPEGSAISSEIEEKENTDVSRLEMI